MGRSAGHLALGIGEATHAPMTIIPEMFNKTTITVDKIIKLTLSAILKRNILGIPYGTVVVAEGVFHDLDPEDLKSTGVHMTYDEHGHPELGKISKAVLFNDILDKELQEDRPEGEDPSRGNRIRRTLPGSLRLRPHVLHRTRNGRI